jgi:hypothetical protein
MLLKNAKDWNNSSLLTRYLGALLVTGLAFAVRYMIHPYIEPYLPVQLFFLSTFVVSLIWGIGPGILSLLVGLVAGYYFFTRPYESFATPSINDVWVMLTYTSTSLVMQALTEYTRRLMYSSELLLKVADSNYRLSLYSENEKIDVSRKYRNNQKEVDEFVANLNQTLFLLSSDNRAQFLGQAHHHFDTHLLVSLQDEWSAIFSSDDLERIQTAKKLALELNNLPSSFNFRFSNEEPSNPMRQGEFKQIKIGNDFILVCSVKSHAFSMV